MAKPFKIRCPRPPNRIILHRQKNLVGPFFQDNTFRCVKSLGNFYAPGMPGSGPQAVSGLVTDATSIRITFSQCVSVPGPMTGIQYRIDGGTWTQVTSAAKISDTVWDFTVGTISAGDDVDWRYVGGSGTMVDCDEAADIGDQQIPVDNPLVLAGDFVLLETGGSDIIALEDDVDGTSGIKLENAT